jgi:hypothetical protein
MRGIQVPKPTRRGEGQDQGTVRRTVRSVSQRYRASNPELPPDPESVRWTPQDWGPVAALADPSNASEAES